MSLRDLSVRLGQDLEDKIEQRFGFREYALEIPGYGTLEPRPRIEQVDFSNSKESELAVFADSTKDGGLPIAGYRAVVSRAVPESVVRRVTQWVLTPDETGVPVDVKVVNLQKTDDRWLVLLSVMKRTPFS